METAQENPNIENESSNSESGSRSKKENSVEETSIEGNDTKFMNAENGSLRVCFFLPSCDVFHK